MRNLSSIIIVPVLAFTLGACSNAQTDHPVPDKTTHEHLLKAAEHPNIIRQKSDFSPVAQPFVPTNKMLSTTENASGIVFYESILPPRSPGFPPHTHVDDEEFFYVAKGSLDVMSGDKVMRIEEGGFAALLPGTAHMFWNASGETTTIIMGVSDGHFEDFFDNVGEMLEILKPANMAEAQPAIIEFAKARGTIIDMSLMPAEAAPYYQPPAE